MKNTAIIQYITVIFTKICNNQKQLFADVQDLFKRIFKGMLIYPFSPNFLKIRKLEKKKTN